MTESKQLLTIILWFDIACGVSIDDPESEHGKIFRNALALVAKGGGFPVYWGRLIDNPDVVLCFGTYESLDACLASTNSQWRRTALKALMGLSSTFYKVCHVEFEENITAALDSPITTLVAAFFDPSEDMADRRSGYEDFFVRYQARLSLLPGGALAGIFTGWSLEDDIDYMPSTDTKYRKGKGFFMASGWESPEQMLGFHSSETAVDQQAGVFEIVDGMTMHNVRLNCIDKDFADG